MISAIHHRGSDEIKVKHETSAAYDSQSNGGTEVGVRNARELFRTLKACLAERVKHYVPPGHALIPWLLQHCCTLLNVRVKGDDGKTSWARIRGRNSNQLLLGFGESILWKCHLMAHSAPRTATWEPSGMMELSSDIIAPAILTLSVRRMACIWSGPFREHR